ncbi:MAG: MarR family transcriptional regulator [Alphaproteobacteria bacterium]|nr:MarR family transcriptional regulator [Alphaproteobacteria bacterium]
MTRRAGRGDGVGALYRRPGFLIRHCHQIGVAIFVEELAAFALTPGQYGALLLIGQHPGLDQCTLAEAIGLDRSTTGAIVTRLARRGLVVRAVNPADRRGRVLRLTPNGQRLLGRARVAARRAQRRLLAPLAAAQRDTFVAHLVRLVVAHADVARAPFVPLAVLPPAAVDKRRRTGKS